MPAIKRGRGYGRKMRTKTPPHDRPPTPNEEMVAFLQLCIVDLQDVSKRLETCQDQSWDIMGMETLDDLRGEVANLLYNCNNLWDQINGK